MDYGKALKVARALSGTQQKALAEAAGVDASYVSLIEMGKRTPSLAAIEKFSEALGIPVHLLTLLACEPQDLELSDPEELRRVAESLASLLFRHKGTGKSTSSPKGKLPGRERR